MPARHSLPGNGLENAPLRVPAVRAKTVRAEALHGSRPRRGTCCNGGHAEQVRPATEPPLEGMRGEPRVAGKFKRFACTELNGSCKGDGASREEGRLFVYMSALAALSSETQDPEVQQACVEQKNLQEY